MAETRRTFFGTLCGLLALPFTRKQRYPWGARAEELFESEGMYADFVAFEEWAERDWERVAAGYMGIPDWDEVDTLEKLAMADMCRRAIDESREQRDD